MNEKILKKDYDKIFEIIQQSFPENEYRIYEEQLELLDNNNYNIIFKKENNQIVCFIAYWEFDNFIFIEHFAVSKSNRNAGVGTTFLKKFLSECDKKVILEVELPIEEFAKKRIEFYKRIGFCENQYPYIQPALRKTSLPLPLKLLSYQNPIDEEEYLLIKDTLYKNVYKVMDID